MIKMYEDYNKLMKEIWGSRNRKQEIIENSEMYADLYNNDVLNDYGTYDNYIDDVEDLINKII